MREFLKSATIEVARQEGGGGEGMGVHIHLLTLIEKVICDLQNISTNFPCVCMCISSEDLFIFRSVFPFFFNFLCYPYFGTFLSM